MIKFNRYHVTDGTRKARVWYSLDNRIDGRKAVTLYAKDFKSGDLLGELFASDYRNDTDSMTDLFDTGRVVLFEDSPHYTAARQRAETIEAERAARRAA